MIMKLANHLEIPNIGLGVYQINESEMKDVILRACQD